jgi:hypothetical protein
MLRKGEQMTPLSREKQKWRAGAGSLNFRYVHERKNVCIHHSP